jgi:hypothetical protein
VGSGVTRRAVLPECEDAVQIIDDYPGLFIRSLAQKTVETRGGNPDTDDDAFKKAMRDASAAAKCGYVIRIGDQFWPLGYPLADVA